jgi:hypothetical protein
MALMRGRYSVRVPMIDSFDGVDAEVLGENCGAWFRARPCNQKDCLGFRDRLRHAWEVLWGRAWAVVFAQDLVDQGYELKPTKGSSTSPEHLVFSRGKKVMFVSKMGLAYGGADRRFRSLGGDGKHHVWDSDQ